MLPEGLLPKIPGLSLEKIKLESDILELVTTNRIKSSLCSVCGHKSSRIHSNYVRRLSDLPWAGFQTTLFLKVHKFFCDNPECPRKIFTQRLKGLKAYARRTTRASSQLVSIGMYTGGNGGSRLAMKLGMMVSASTVLRLILAQNIGQNSPPRVLGIDDWAMRKGQIYGTILVDLEKHKAIDLLPDRESETLEKWLKNYPGIEIISRDRAGNYAEGATKGAPQAIQVADRWHLLKNLTEALKRIMEKHQQHNRQVALAIAKKNREVEMEQYTKRGKINMPEETAIPQKKKEPSRFELLFNEVKVLQEKGLSQREIARRLQIHRRTVKKYFQHATFPGRIGKPEKESKVLPFGDYLRKRWSEDNHGLPDLHKEIKKNGFDGSWSTFYRYMKKNFPLEDRKAELVFPLKLKLYSPKYLSFLLAREEQKLAPEEMEYLSCLFKVSPQVKTANELALRFRQIIVNRKHKDLDSWLEDAIESGPGILKNFAQKLKQDYEAVKNACSVKWSNGQVEGQVNRLKNIKRQMYGRASFTLLRKRVLADTG